MSSRSKQPTKRGTPPPAKKNDYSDDLPTEIMDPAERAQAQTASTSPKQQLTPAPPVLPAPGSPIVAHSAKPKFQTISMKTPANPKQAPIEKPEREMPHVKLRAMSEVSKAQLPQNLGNLAPPYDPAQARARTMRDLVIWGCIAVMLASVIALGVWFLAA